MPLLRKIIETAKYFTVISGLRIPETKNRKENEVY